LKAIILSAGQGRRLLPLTEDMPKCCLEIEGKTLLEWQIDSLTANGISEIVVVTGFGHHVVDDIVSRIDRPEIRTVYNPFYALSDNLGTCWVARGEMSGSFVLINGDTLFEPAVLGCLLAHQRPMPITLNTDQKPLYDDDDMKVIAIDERLTRVGKKLDLADVTGESIGMMIFDADGATRFVDKVEHLMNGPDGLARWYLTAIDELAAAGQVGICAINGLSWCEVDDLDDLVNAGRIVRGWASFLLPEDELRSSTVTGI